MTEEVKAGGVVDMQCQFIRLESMGGIPLPIAAIVACVAAFGFAEGPYGN